MLVPRLSLESPGKKKPMILSDYWKKTHEFKKDERPNFKRMGQTIQRAMDAGQSSCVILRFVRQDFVPRDAIQTPRGGLFSNVSQDNPKLDDSLSPVIQWLHKEGLEYRVSIPVISNVFTVVYNNFADLIAYWEPKLDISPQQKLLDYWIRQKTCKCLDMSFADQWFATCQRAMDSGQQHAILMTIYAGPDYTFQVIEFEDTNIRCGKDLMPVKGSVELTPEKFDHVTKWIHDNKLKHFIIVSDPVEPSWAYLCVAWGL